MKLINQIINFFKRLFSSLKSSDSKNNKTTAKGPDKKTSPAKQETKTLNSRLIIALVSIVAFISIISIVTLIYKKGPPTAAKITFNIQAPPLTPLHENARPHPLLVEFSGSVAKLEDLQKVVENGIELKPGLQGEWKWTGDNLLEFTPQTDWPAGTEYTVYFNENLFPEHILLNDYKKSFKTHPFNIRLESNSFYIDPRNEDLKQIASTVSFSHPVKVETFEKNVTLRPVKIPDGIRSFKNRKYELNITYDDFFGKAYILSEALPMPEDDVTMELVVEEGVEPQNDGEESTDEIKSRVTVPGVSNYIQINNLSQTIVRNKEYKLEQIIVIDTKGRVRTQDLANNMEAWILPKDLPETPGSKFVKNYRWSDPAKIGPEVLKLSGKLEFTPLETEHEYESLNSFKIQCEPLKYVYFKIKKGTPFYGKYQLSKNYERIVRISSYPQQLEIMHDGIILSSTGAKKISIMSQGISDVHFQIGRVQPDQLNHLVSQSNGDLTNLNFQNYRFNEENLVENKYETRSLNILAPGEPNYFSFDFSPYLSQEAGGKVRNGIFFFEVREWDRNRQRAIGLSSKRLIMISDLGILTKEGTNSTHEIFVQSISSGIPVAGAKVQVLGKNGIPVLTRTTNENGHVSLPSLDSFINEKKATVYVISKNDDLTFLPVQAPGRWLNYSRFETGGVHGATNPNKIDAFLFSDRGIYRPGDLFNIGMIVKAGNWNISLTNTPLEATITDARGLQIYSKKIKLSSAGFEEFEYQTENTSPTGTYQINLYNIKNHKYRQIIGSTTIRVEEFLPDRLTINSLFPGLKDEAWVSPDDLKAMVTLRNLYGTPARGNLISAKMSLTPGRLWFRPYRDFIFNNPFNYEKFYTENLEDKYTDEEGKAVFDFNLNRFEAATYSLVFSADGFEKESGRSVSTESRILISPLKYIIGTKADGDLSYIYNNSERKIKIIAVNSSLQKVAAPDMVFELFEIQNTSVLTKLPNGTYAYKSVEKSFRVDKTTQNISSTGMDYTLATNNPGEYELNIKNKEGIEFSKIKYSVIGMGNITRSLDKSAELEIKLNKTDYEPYEEIEIFVKAPYPGSGLITVERDKVYSYQWFNSQNNSFIRKIKIPSGMEGNGYINVSYVRAADSREIYMSPLSYGIAPFSISKKNRTNNITITVPSEARSGKEFPIKYKTDKPAKIVVFAVDEGILQVADFQTPDPLAHFFKKRALEVRTSQLLDLILPEFKLIQNTAAMGGGMGFDDIAKNLNPFKRKSDKPVVYWSGIINSDPTERTLKYEVPDYFNGTLRVMAIAVSNDAIGRFEEKSIVKNPFIISPNLPMFAAPEDSFLATVTITNSLNGSSNKSPLELEVTPTAHLKITNLKRKLFLNKDRDTTLTFNIKVNNLPGAAELKFKVSGFNETTQLASYLSIRPAIPYKTTIISGSIKDDDVDIEIPRQLYKEYRVLETMASFLPVGLSKGLVSYLDQFPYGCTEQVISQAFPYLFLRDVNGFGIQDKKASEKIKYALKVLQARQNSVGKFGIWAANEYTSDFITVYGMHFITECIKAGYNVPDQMKERTLNALKDIASQKKLNLHDIRVQTYAIYLLTLNEFVTTNYISAIRKNLDDKHKSWESELSGAYLAASYMLMKQSDEANSIFEVTAEAKLEGIQSWHFCDYSIQNAQLLYLFSLHAPDFLGDTSDRFLKGITRSITDGSYNTIFSSYAVMALTKYAAVTGAPENARVLITQILKNKKEETLSLPSGNFPVVSYSENARELNIKNDTQLNLFYQVVQGGFDTTPPHKRISEGIEIYREFRNIAGDVINKALLGEEVKVYLKLRSINNQLYNIAVVDMLPAGLEASPVSVRDNLRGSWNPEYTDIREDRLVIFGTFTPSVQEFVYTVRAINKGTFVVPPLFGESMYDRSIYGYAPQQSFTIE
jgi:hypothetical protein